MAPQTARNPEGTRKSTRQRALEAQARIHKMSAQGRLTSSSSESEPAPTDRYSQGGSSSDGGHNGLTGLAAPEALVEAFPPAAAGPASPRAFASRPAPNPGLRMLAEAAEEAARAGPSNSKKYGKAQQKAGRTHAAAAGGKELWPHAVLLARGEQMDLELLEKRATLGLQIKAGLDADPAARMAFATGRSKAACDTVMGMPAMVGKAVVYSLAALRGTPPPHHEATIVEKGLLRCSEPSCQFEGTRGEYERKHLGSKNANAVKYIYLKEAKVNLRDLVAYAASPDLSLTRCVYCKDNEGGLTACATCPCVFHQSCYEANTHDTVSDYDDWQCLSCRQAILCSADAYCTWCEAQRPHEGRFTLDKHLKDLHRRLTANPPRGLPIGSLSHLTAPAAPPAPITAGQGQLPGAPTGPSGLAGAMAALAGTSNPAQWARQRSAADEAPAGPSGSAGTMADRAGISNPANRLHPRTAADEAPASHSEQSSADIGNQAELTRLKEVIKQLNLADLSSCKLPKWRDLDPEGDLSVRLSKIQAALVAELFECINAPAFMTDLLCHGIQNVLCGSEQMLNRFIANYTAVRQWVEDRQRVEKRFRASLRRLLEQMFV